MTLCRFKTCSVLLTKANQKSAVTSVPSAQILRIYSSCALKRSVSCCTKRVRSLRFLGNSLASKYPFSTLFISSNAFMFLYFFSVNLLQFYDSCIAPFSPLSGTAFFRIMPVSCFLLLIGDHLCRRSPVGYEL